MPNADEIRRNQPPADPAVQSLLANIPEFDPRRQQIEDFREKWLRKPPEPDNTKETAP